jgi:hypothetical protein
MHSMLLLFYAGPDQIMTVTSGLASVFGLILIFWSKVVRMFFRIVRVFWPSAPEQEPKQGKPNSVVETS